MLGGGALAEQSRRVARRLISSDPRCAVDLTALRETVGEAGFQAPGRGKNVFFVELFVFASLDGHNVPMGDIVSNVICILELQNLVLTDLISIFEPSM